MTENETSQGTFEAAGQSGDGFVIRRARREDIAAVAALDEQVSGVAKDAYLSELFESYQTRRAEQRFFYVAEDSGEEHRILGFAIGEIRAWEFGSTPCGWVFALSVEPGVREEGVGEALLRHMSDGFRRAGVRKLRTMVRHRNHLLLSFFRSEGLKAGPYLQLEKELR